MKAGVFAVSMIIYIAYFTGLVLLLSDVLAYIKGRLTLRRRLMSMKQRDPGFIEAKLDALFFMAFGKENKGKYLGFFCLLLFAVSFIYTFLHFGIFFSLIIALLVASVPLVSLVSKNQNQRNRSGREGLPFANEIYRQYMMGDKNILTALERTLAASCEYPECGRQAGRLLLRLRAAGDRKAVKNACSDFAGAIGSSWARNMGNAFVSAYDGVDIQEALLDICERIKLKRKDGEEKKRLNQEASRMTVFMVPFMYAATLFMSVRVLGLSFEEIIRNQFLDRTGLMLFLAACLLFFINCLLISAVNGSSADL